ncbi:virulence factor SrfC family protein [Mangrovibacter yixingensis]|uniref:virulence factor SrfC family protein n=1 Tax=Mangrovibacter yixingensis TaxID=1529639 RepID=UPI001CF9F2A0|nr:virulence factor SrfC family protein [Mangrovibacter yixingensis]
MSRKITTADTLAALINWVEKYREQASVLDEDGDRLCQHVQEKQFSLRQLEQSLESPPALGLYGQGYDAKAWLLRALTDSPDGRVQISAQGRSIDYLSHIQPGHTAATMAVRFTTQPQTTAKGYPVTLRLLSETALVALFMSYYHYQPGLQPLPPSRLQSRLQQAALRRQPGIQTTVNPQEVSLLARHWAQLPARTTWPVSDADWFRIARLLPELSLDDRQSLYSLFWGDNPELTSQWRILADALARLNGVQTVCAPLDLLVDAFSLPTENFLCPAEFDLDQDQGDVIVCPVQQNRVEGQVSIALSSLALLCYEVVFTLAGTPALDGVDLLDLPPYGKPGSLQKTRALMLPDLYAWQTSPDLLLINQAVSSRRDIYPVSQLLKRWQQATQASTENGDNLPGMAWVITPFDGRQHGQNPLDDGLQRLCGKPGVDWGTLQALDEHNLSRLKRWLQDALTPERHQQRLASLIAGLRADVRLLFSSYAVTEQADPEQTKSLANQLVRALQRQAQYHGDIIRGLLPPAGLTESLNNEQSQPVVSALPIFDPGLDLFSDDPKPAATESTATLPPGQTLFLQWVRHVRQWAGMPDTPVSTGLSPDELQLLADIIITTSYRTGLREQLEKAPTNLVAGYALLGNFITWLGYSEIPLEQRPQSRVNRGKGIFAPHIQEGGAVRLTRLGEQPVHAATHYVYDWLVALYQCALENRDYARPGDLNKTQRKALVTLVSRLA